MFKVFAKARTGSRTHTHTHTQDHAHTHTHTRTRTPVRMDWLKHVLQIVSHPLHQPRLLLIDGLPIAVVNRRGVIKSRNERQKGLHLGGASFCFFLINVRACCYQREQARACGVWLRSLSHFPTSLASTSFHSRSSHQSISNTCLFRSRRIYVSHACRLKRRTTARLFHYPPKCSL